MNIHIEDQLVDNLKIIWEETTQYSGLKVVDVSPKLRVIQDFLTTQFWPSLVRFIASGVLNRHGRIKEYSGFMFPEDLDPGDDPFEGVMIFDPLDTIYLSDTVFDRLMNRYFQKLIEGATKYEKDVLKEDWWIEFLDIAKEIEQRVNG
jgi:hypothetical protein